MGDPESSDPGGVWEHTGFMNCFQSLPNSNLPDAVFWLLSLRPDGPWLPFYNGSVATLRTEEAKSDTAQKFLQGTRVSMQ